MNDKYLYRYEYESDYNYLFTGELKLLKYIIKKETDKFYFINDGLWFQKLKKVTKNKKAIKSYARITEKKALEDFIYRYRKYIKILENKLERAKDGLILAENKLKNKNNVL